MDTANAISGVSSLNASLLRHSQNAPADGDAQAPIPLQGSTRTQPVQPVTHGERSEFSGKDANRDEVTKAVKNMNEFLQKVRRSVEFNIDEDSGRMVVQVKDAETHEVIRQIPSEQMLKIAKQMDKLYGLLFEESV